MISTIDKLLRLKEYNIFNNVNISEEKLEELAKIFSEDKSLDLAEFFTPYSSKFCWKNIALIIEKMDKSQQSRGFPLLFMFLQDINWPVFEIAIKVLSTIEKDKIMPYVERYLEQAYQEKDYMWIGGIKILAQAMNIKQIDFQNKDNYEIFQYSDYDE